MVREEGIHPTVMIAFRLTTMIRGTRESSLRRVSARARKNLGAGGAAGARVEGTAPAGNVFLQKVPRLREEQIIRELQEGGSIPGLQ